MRCRHDSHRGLTTAAATAVCCCWRYGPCRAEGSGTAQYNPGPAGLVRAVPLSPLPPLWGSCVEFAGWCEGRGKRTALALVSGSHFPRFAICTRAAARFILPLPAVAAVVSATWRLFGLSMLSAGCRQCHGVVAMRAGPVLMRRIIRPTCFAMLLEALRGTGGHPWTGFGLSRPVVCGLVVWRRRLILWRGAGEGRCNSRPPFEYLETATRHLA